MTARFWLLAGALLGMLTVALGAFGAHGLQDRLTDASLANWHTATRYLGLHASALLTSGLILMQRPDARLIGLAAAAFLVGSLLFSGSLYAIALSGVSAFGRVTPFGGLILLLAWALLGVGSWRHLAPTAPSKRS